MFVYAQTTSKRIQKKVLRSDYICGVVSEISQNSER